MAVSTHTLVSLYVLTVHMCTYMLKGLCVLKVHTWAHLGGLVCAHTCIL